MPIRAHCLGYPCIGKHLEWAKAARKSYILSLPAERLEPLIVAHLRQRWLEMTAAGIIEPPSNDFAIDNPVLDAAIMLGAVPDCYRSIADPLMRYWTMAQGEPQWRLHRHARPVLEPLPRCRWFDTSHSCSVPQLPRSQRFSLDASKILREIAEARALNIETRPVILGPMTFLLHSQTEGPVCELLTRLLPIYEELLVRLAAERVSWVQLDEPCLVLNLDDEQREGYRRALAQLSSCQPRPKLLLTTYFGSLVPNLPLAIDSGCEGLHIDVVSAPEQRKTVMQSLGAHQTLSLGVIDGRNVFRADLQLTHTLLRCAVTKFGSERVWASTSCSLRHVPMDVELEESFDAELKSELAFATQKLEELELLARSATESKIEGEIFERNRRMVAQRTWALRYQQSRKPIDTAALQRSTAFDERRREQSYSVPLTSPSAICDQDGVEQCASKLSGFVVTEHGWVQLDGLHRVRPPILHHDVARERPVSPAWERLHTALDRPLTASLPEPMALFNGSFRCTELSSDTIVLQISLALAQEREALQAAGIRVAEPDPKPHE